MYRYMKSRNISKNEPLLEFVRRLSFLYNKMPPHFPFFPFFEVKNDVT